MTMMASFLSNINIPAGSLFSPGAKPLFHFESSLWRLETFPWYFSLCSFICLYPGDVPTSHIKHRLPYFLGAEVKTIVTGELGGCVSLPQSAYPETDIQSAEAEKEVLTSASVRKAQSWESANVRNWSPKRLIFFFHLSVLNETHLVYGTARWD